MFPGTAIEEEQGEHSVVVAKKRSQKKRPPKMVAEEWSPPGGRSPTRSLAQETNFKENWIVKTIDAACAWVGAELQRGVI